MFGKEEAFELLIQGLVKNGYGVMDNFLSDELQFSLRKILLDHLENGDMKSAGIGQELSQQNNQEIRSDRTRWIEAGDDIEVEHQLLKQLWNFVAYLNLTCYTGLNDLECHYAWYDKGSFYKKHLDQFKSDSGRKYSIVLYLNDAWKEGDGGQLVLYGLDATISINPIGGRIVFFESDKIEHEVMVTNLPRLSLTGWMKSV